MVTQHINIYIDISPLLLVSQLFLKNIHSLLTQTFGKFFQFSNQLGKISSVLPQ